MHDAITLNRFFELRDLGLGARRIARELDLPLSTVRDWTAGRTPRRTRRPEDRCPRCGAQPHAFEHLPAVYAYLLGLYLGDGCLAAHARGVFKLRIVLDAAYPALIAEARAACDAITGRQSNIWTKPQNCVEVYSYWRQWACLLPQHGPGKKHDRPIELADWQIAAVRRTPELFLRGMIHSDGCRFENTGRGGWRAPRYSFSNYSEDILALFCWACELLEVRWTDANNTIYVSRKADVARLDEYIGPKR